MAIPKDQKPAERFASTPQRRITKEMFLARSFTVKPLEAPIPAPRKERDLIDQFVTGQLARIDRAFANRLFQPAPVFQPLPPAMPKAKPWTLDDVMPQKWPQPPMPVPKSFKDRYPTLPVHHVPSHTSRLFDPTSLCRMAEAVAKICLDEKIEALLVCGISGLILAGAASVLGDIRVLAARKPSENPVAGTQGLRVCGIAPSGPFKRWAWLDDHIGSGGTFQRSRGLAKEARLIASAIPSLIILYEGSGRYLMTEEQFIGIRLSWEVDALTPGISMVESVRV